MLLITLSWIPIQVYPQKLEEEIIRFNQSPTISSETTARIYDNNPPPASKGSAEAM